MHICKLWVFTETTSLFLWGISAYILPPDPTSVWDLHGLFGGPYIFVGFTGSVWWTLHLCGIYWVCLGLISAYVAGGGEGGEVHGGTFKQDR